MFCNVYCGKGIPLAVKISTSGVSITKGVKQDKLF